VARGAAKQRTAARVNGARTRGGGRPARPAYEQTMFFPRLRRQAKWVFVFLAAVFAIGFVFFGVGSGSNGISDVMSSFSSIFGGSSSTNSAAVKKALKRTQQHPNDPAAWNDLANAYSQQGDIGKANAAVERYVALRPKDDSAWQRIAGYYESKGADKNTEASTLQAQAPLSMPLALGLSQTSPLSQALGQDQVTQMYTQQANAAFQQALANYRKAEDAYRRIVALRPTSVSDQLHLAQLADGLGDTSVALTAYRRVVALSPAADPNARIAKQRIKLLSSALARTTHR
jgi:tetratricopeptide (TPR) repeat protein